MIITCRKTFHTQCKTSRAKRNNFTFNITQEAHFTCKQFTLKQVTGETAIYTLCIQTYTRGKHSFCTIYILMQCVWRDVRERRLPHRTAPWAVRRQATSQPYVLGPYIHGTWTCDPLVSKPSPDSYHCPSNNPNTCGLFISHVKTFLHMYLFAIFSQLN